MASPQQPLPDSSKYKSPTFFCKFFLLFISSAAIICPSASIAFNVINNEPHLSLPSQTCGDLHDPTSCFQIFLYNSLPRIVNAKDAAHHISRQINDAREQQALADCVELMDLSIDRVKDSAKAIGRATTRSFADAHAWLSSILTNHMNCHDGLMSGLAQSAMEAHLQDLIERASSSLEMFITMSPPAEEALRPLHGEFPSWVTSRDRKLLEPLPRGLKPKPNVVVAKDGSGKYKTVQEAVTSAPEFGVGRDSRYVIHVKKGTYNENVVVGSTQRNLMIVGDGMDVTIITGSRYCNNKTGSTTLDNCATLVAVATQFILQDITIQNTAGPEREQAVALRVHADLSVINRCRIDAYQGTLYAHNLRQFYRECDISGTIDFIFGDATAVFQNCKLIAKKGIKGNKNTVTAQGRYMQTQSSGFSIQNCTIIPKSDLAPVKSSFPTYLGRPLKEYSRTMVMESHIGEHIDPKGWAPWNASDYALNTLFFGEYRNRGPGADMGNRVKWTTFHKIIFPAIANLFTVKEFIMGDQWLKQTGVAFTGGLMSVD